MVDQINATPQFADADRREKQRPILLACFGEKSPYARVGPLALAGLADHIGVNQIRNQRCQPNA
jgi:hypothetical protein